MYKCIGVETVPNINIFTSFSLPPANKLEVFFMFPQAKNRQESKAQGLTPHEPNQDYKYLEYAIRMAILSLRTADYQSTCRIYRMIHCTRHAYT